MFRVNNFDKLLDKATSNLRLDPDWPTILQICDLIRQNDCTPKYAVAALKKKLYSQNPHQAMFALLVLESIVKNCGSGIHDEVTSKVFCEMLRDLVKSTQHENLKSKILELIQAWAFAFRNTPKYRAVQDTVNILKAEGFKFPALKESDAMFSADTAPEWADGEVCHRCRVAFTLMVRRHHCRACGQVFCQQCSSKTSTLPKFGIEKEVRVCDACYDKVSRPPSSTAKIDIVDTSSDYGAPQPQKRNGKTAEELQEEEELQLALALSQSEAEQKEKERKSRLYSAPDPIQLPSVSPTPSSVNASPEHSTANAELSRYLDRGYWEQRMTRDSPAAAPTAPTSQPSASPAEDFNKVTPRKSQPVEAEDDELLDFVATLKSQIEIFVNRMKSNSSRGRSIANDTSVQSLFMNMTDMHSRLLRYIQRQDDKRAYYESLQDKVNQVRDSRAALDTLRAEHSARLAAAAEAAERQRQMQMAAKLQVMRKKKHEYLQYQRQLALQRVQEQEREMQMRQEQQKYQYMLSPTGVLLRGYPYQNMGNQRMYANPQQFHPQMMPAASQDGPSSMPGQPQMSQADIQMGLSQTGAISQSMPQIPHTFAMSTANVMNQPPINAQASMNHPIHSSVGQQMSLQPQMFMQHMHQMRMPVQAGVHQMMPQNLHNSMPGQNMLPQNGSSQIIPKQNFPNQQQQGSIPVTSQMPGQQTLGQTSTTNPLLGVQMQNMGMPLMQGNQQGPNQIPVSGYSMTPHSAPQMTNIPPQMSVPAQGMPMSVQQMLPNQPDHGQGMHNQMPPTSQSMPSQGSQVPSQNQQQMQQPQVSSVQPIQGQMQTGQQTNMHGPQMLSHPQNIPLNGQQMPGHQMMNQHLSMQGQPQMPTMQMPAQQMQMQHQHQMQNQIPHQSHQNATQPQFQQQMPPQGLQMQQPQGVSQQMKMPQQTPSGQQTVSNPQKPTQTPVKSEHNNNTAELISFD